MSSSISDKSELDPDMSQSCSAGGVSDIPVLVMDVFAEGFVDAAAEAEAEANEDPTLGACGSGVMLVKRVSHAAPPSGLRLRSLSPSPSRLESLRACRLRFASDILLLRACTLSDMSALVGR
jgi:hypothetical protein